VAQLIEALDAAAVAANLERVTREIAAAGRAPAEVEVLVAVKYLRAELLGTLAQAGVTLVAENRSQALEAKQAACPDVFTWDFIGALQSRKVKSLLGRVRLIHSLASDSAREQLSRHDRCGTQFLIEVNVAREPGKAGVDPAALPQFIEACPEPPLGLMTMPPRASHPEDSRRHFSALRELAERHGLRELSMGTTQDYRVALEEGATIIRLGTGILLPREDPGAS
jgi:PLP dependent protein